MLVRETRRFLRTNLLLSLSGALILALGIGASTLALALLNTFSSLSYPGMQTAGFATVAEETLGGGSARVSWRRLDQLRAEHSFDGAFGLYSSSFSVVMDSAQHREYRKLAAVSSQFFSNFTPHLAAGREFSTEEEMTAGSHLIILNYTFANSLFSSPSAAIGQTIRLKGSYYEVIGVAPSGFEGLFGEVVDAWVPANCVIPLLLDMPGNSSNPSVDAEQWREIRTFYGVFASHHESAPTLVSALSRSLSLRKPGDAPMHVSAGLTSDPLRDATMTKWLRLGLVLAFVFTGMSSLNYSFLLFARVPRLLQEVQLKRALGASTWKLTIELMTGPAAIVGIGFVLAAALFSLAMMVVGSISPFYKELVAGSWRTAAFAIAVQFLISCALSLIVGLLPALPVLRQLHASGMWRSSTASRGSNVLLQSVVIMQISFCIGALLIAGMVLSSLIGLMRVPLGYDPHQSDVIQLTPRSETISFISGNHHSFPDVEAIHAFERDFLGLSGVESISYATYVPFGEIPGTVFIERMPGSQTGGHTVNTVTVSPGYFHTMRTNIVRGRGFQPYSRGSLEVIVNKALSKELWPDQDPINGSIRVVLPAFSGMPSSSFQATVIGVCEDIRISGAAETPTPTIILSTDGASFFNIDPSFIIRTVLPLHTIESAAQANASRLLPDFQVSAVESIEEKAYASLSPERTRTICAVAGALLMTLVGLLGLYASLSYYVTSRRRELAVRICLGASKASLRKIIMTQAAQCAGFSALITVPFWPFLAGLSVNEYLGRLTWSLPQALCISLACICLSVGLSIIPAAKATRISPSQALKEE